MRPREDLFSYLFRYLLKKEVEQEQAYARNQDGPFKSFSRDYNRLVTQKVQQLL